MLLVFKMLEIKLNKYGYLTFLMPLINVKTSISNIENSESFLHEISNALSSITGKPEQYVMTLLQTKVPMTFGGTTDPCCYVEIKSIGAIDSAKMAPIFCTLISKWTDIPSHRIYIGFEDVPAKLWGWDGRTFG